LTRSRTLVPVYAAHSLVHLLLTLFPAVLFTLRAEYGQSYATLGATYGAAMLVYGLGALPVGMLANRIRPLTFLRVSTGAAARCAAAIAVAPGPFWFAAGLVALGAACSVHHTAALTLITRAAHSDPRIFGHWGMMGNLGLAAAPAFGGLLAAWVSWRLPFAAGAALGVCVTAWLCLGTAHIKDAALTETRTAEEPQATHLPSLTLIYVISAALGFVFTGFAAFLPAITGVRVAFLPASALVRGGLVASLVYSVGFFGQWWGGHAGRRRHLEQRYTLIIGLNAVCLALAFVLQDWALVAILAAFSFVHFSTQPLENTLIARFTSHEARGMSFAVSCALNFGVGALGAWTGGLVADAAGGRLQYVFLMLAAVAGVATLCGIALQRSARAARRRT
jgi:predicted MFS family arabinose efflux permease